MNPKYSDFGYPTLLDILPSAIDTNMVKEALESHKDALVSFIVDRPHYHKRMCVIGSGFFAYSTDPTIALLITARHVLTEFEENGFGWITVGTKMIQIGNVGIRKIDSKKDLAVWEIPSEYLIHIGIQGIETFPLFDAVDQEKLFFPTSSFAIFGYPGSKNRKIDMREWGNRDRHLFGLALHGYQVDHASSELCFPYTGAVIPEACSKEITSPPALDGMSGSPCVRFVVHKEQRRPAVIVAGVFTDWKEKRELRAAALDSPWLLKR